ncbi:hypothetical protein N0V83_000188 [Neocucurbitaria cava]|uniref:Uncharacterized protein n=1 Tax=Neocucurbitaria cava TaxID=798079 RepID=A0A9W9CRR6_9PLEO|nr:hypothetical protein N0V83_000188 [Neocucurbitaria cava]
MPPKQIHGKGRTVAEPSFARNAIRTFTSPDNRSVVSAVGLFAVRHHDPFAVREDVERSALWSRWNGIGVAFLHSSWAEILLPA